TNQAAAEMRERISGLVGKQRAKLLTVGTFHSTCVRLLREYGAAIGVPEKFTICDTADQTALLKGALRELHISESSIQPAALQAAISLAKNRLESPEAFLDGARGDREELIGRAWKRYNDALERARLLDFDDLLLRALELLGDEEVLGTLRARFRRVLVDEFQDTNAPQYEIVRALCREHRNLCAVGDDDQSIYGWRGADVKKILNFEHHFPEAKIVRLETNYRSTASILSAANRVIANNPNRHEKVLRAHAGDGEPVRVARMEDETVEADGVVIEIQDEVRRRKAKYSDYAILFRTAVQPRAFEAQLRARGVPYRLVGGMSFFDRKEVRDVLAYMRLVVNPLDEASFLRIVNRPPRGVGKASLERAMDYATAHAISVPKAFEYPEAVEAEFAKIPPAAVEAVHGLKRLLKTLYQSAPG
ncbi:MAG: UvrD-helicase domain-containing protein, partial [Planctomycetota bacterium]